MLRQPQRPKSSGEGLVYRRISECFSLSESSSRTVTCVELFGLVAYKFPCLLLAFTKVSVLSFELEPVYIVYIVELKGMSDCPSYWSHKPKNVLLVRWGNDSRKKKNKEIFETEKVSFFYWLSIGNI